MKDESFSSPGVKASGILLGAAFAGMLVPDQAQAQVVNESTDFGNVFPNRAILPNGTVLVNGSLDNLTEGFTDNADFFQISGLPANVQITLGLSGALIANNGGSTDVVFTFFNSAGSSISGFGLGTLNSGSPTFNTSVAVTIPADGILVTEVSLEGVGHITYSVSIPEPSVSVLMATGALAALLARRGQKRKSEESQS